MKHKNLVSPLYAEVKTKTNYRPRKRSTTGEVPKCLQNKPIFEALFGLSRGAFVDIQEPVFGSLRGSIFTEIKGLNKHGHEYQTQRIDTTTRVWRLK